MSFACRNTHVNQMLGRGKPCFRNLKGEGSLMSFETVVSCISGAQMLTNAYAMFDEVVAGTILAIRSAEVIFVICPFVRLTPRSGRFDRCCSATGVGAVSWMSGGDSNCGCTVRCDDVRSLLLGGPESMLS